jgi:glucose/arabinose dehydrogenase
MVFWALKGALAVVLCASLTSAQECASIKTPSYPAPVVGSGWTVQLVSTELTNPRSLLFDDNGNLLVVEQGAGIRHIRLETRSPVCTEVSVNSWVVENPDVCSVLWSISKDNYVIVN